MRGLVFVCAVALCIFAATWAVEDAAAGDWGWATMNAIGFAAWAWIAGRTLTRE